MSQTQPTTLTGHWRQRLVRSTFSLGIRQGLVAGLTAIGVLLLSRIQTPAEFAFFGWTTAVATMASAVGDFGYGAAMIHSGQARRLAPAAIIRHFRIVVPVTVFVCLIAVALPLSGPVRTAVVLLTVSAALFGAQMLPTSVFEAEGRFGFIGAIEVVQRAGLIAGAVALAEVYHSSWAAPLAAVVAAAFGWGAALVTSGVRRPPSGGNEPAIDTHFAHSWLTGRVANHLNYAVYPLVGTAFLTGHQLGLVLWAVQVSAVPALGGQVAARVIFPAMVGDEKAQSADTHRRAVLCLIAAGAPVVSAMIVFARPIVVLIFGRAWLGAVAVLQIECFNTLLGLILTPTAPAMYVFVPPAQVRTLMIAYTVLTTVLALALVGPVGVTAISIATAISSTIMVGIWGWLLRRHRHPGLAFCLPGCAVAVASFAIGLLWRPTVHHLLPLVLDGAGWTLVTFVAIIIVARPPNPWTRRRTNGQGDLRCA